MHNPQQLSIAKTEPMLLQGPSKEALLGELGSLLEKLDPLCAPPGLVDSVNQLWFHRSEFEVVNQVWATQGISGVYERWGRERDYKAGSLEAPSDQAPILLEIMNFRPSDKIEDAYFKFAHLVVPEIVRAELLTVLGETGLVARVMPDRDSVRNMSLEGADFGDVELRCEMFGSQNPYGSGRFLLVDVALKPQSGGPLSLSLRISSDGDIVRRLWDDELYETGYEGHDFGVFTLAVEELRALLPIVAQVTELASRSPQTGMHGMWNGNSLPS